MKTKIPFLLLAVSTPLFAQWQPDVRLTNDPASSFTSLNNAWCIAASGSVVHVVWWDGRDMNAEIYYKRSTDGGISWGADTRLTTNTGWSWYPSIAVTGSVVHVVWENIREGNAEIYYKRSSDGGVTWGDDTRLTYAPYASVSPSIAVSGSVVHVVWRDDRDGYADIYYKRSSDGGVSWGGDTRLSTIPGGSLWPSVAVSGSVVHVVWHQEYLADIGIYYKRSPDGGISWGDDTRLTSDTAYSQNPSVAVSGSVVHVVWHGWIDQDTDIYYKRSTDGGVSWGSDTRLTIAPYGSVYPSVAVSGSVVHVVWTDGRDGGGNEEIYYKRSTDGGVSWEVDTRLTNNGADSWDPSVAVSGSVVHVVWRDERDVNWEIYYKRNPTGNPTGIKNIGNDIPVEYKLSQNYPNPFNPSTTISFSIPTSEFVTLKVYDVLGREVAMLVNEELKPGSYEVDWDASGFASGLYFYVLKTENFTDTKKMILIK